MQSCHECLRLEALLQQSGLDYLAAANRYNTLQSTRFDNSWAANALRTAKLANDEWQMQFGEHVKGHAQPGRVMAAGV
jgi:hypothetical protein